MHPRRSTLLLAILIGGLCAQAWPLPAPAQARFPLTTYYVDAVNGSNETGDGTPEYPWRTVGFAMERAYPGDTVFARPGVYNWEIGEYYPIAMAPEVRLVGSGRDTTILSAEGMSVLVMDGRAQSLGAVEVRDLTLTFGDVGIAMEVYPAYTLTPTLANLRFTLLNCAICTTSYLGLGTSRQVSITNTEMISNSRGIEVFAGAEGPASYDLRMEDCTLAANWDYGLSFMGVGGGLTATLQMRDTQIRGPQLSGLWVGMYGQALARLRIENSRIEYATDYGFTWHSDIEGNSAIDATITNTVIAHNGSGVSLGSLPAPNNSAVRFVNDTIAFNQAYGIQWIYNPFHVTPYVYNTILWNPNADDLYASGGPGWTANEVQYCDIEDGDLLGQAGNFSLDPLLTADGHLALGSPAIDAGSAAGAPADDIDGQGRPTGAGFDVGADEWWWSVLLPAAWWR